MHAFSALRVRFLLLLQNRWGAASVAFGAGALAALSMAPLNAWPVLFVSLPLLYAAILFAPGWKSAAIYGWLFGFGYFVFGLSWVGNALLVEGNPYQWAWPLAVTGLPALLAFFPAVCTGVARRFLKLNTLCGWFGFGFLYTGSEWLRGHLFTGFPWNLFGYTWADIAPITQIVWLSDVYFLTWLTLFWALLPAYLFLSKARFKRELSLIVLASFFCCLIFGLILFSKGVALRDDINIRLVQPNIDQAEKWDRQRMGDHFKKHLQLSENTENVTQPTIIIWPETSISYRIYDVAMAQYDLQNVLSSYPAGAVLLSGMLRYDTAADHYANALVMVDYTREPKNIYDKHHLVPFGEYIPFQKYIRIAPVVQFQGFQPGTTPQLFETPFGLKYASLICYEIIFPGALPAAVLEHSDFIVNVTNDAWYGISAGPHQHFISAKFRAIESGLPVIRAANTGFSGIIAPDGTIYGQTGLYTDSAQNLKLPFKRPLPAWVLGGKNIAAALFILAGVLSAFWRSRKFSV